MRPPSECPPIARPGLSGGRAAPPLTAAREPAIHESAFSALDAGTLYRILRLRQEVFAVEQDCPYLDADGRDTEADALHVWIDEQPDRPTVSAYLRILAEPGGETSVGRVVTAPAMRGRGLASALVLRALALGAGPHVLNAQSRLVGWYAAFGFTVSGPEFVEDGILHRPMRRPTAPSSRML